ncbi:MAG: rRNA maturation RNase YbeY [Porticoccaceae bacterium]|nr:rRNA maturation RNase YbeY [Porticoccaceae bacterium]
MTIHVDIQVACTSEDSPDQDSIQRWVNAAIRDERETTELSVRIVDTQESRDLNEKYRGASGPTNVLSFPFEAPVPELLPLIGDLVICAPVVALEAQQQQKAIEAHWAHMTIHGVLHLLGYDHQNEHDAEIMESLETDILQGLGFPPPYISE